MPKILNRRRGEEDGIYVGRPTKWGNPFPLHKEEDRERVLASYREWIFAPERAALRAAARVELRGKNLICWCAPRLCHAEILAEIANGEEGGPNGSL